MDPVSVLAITNASIGIARSLVHTIKELYELAEAYETAALGIRTVATQCNSFRIAIQRINKWLEKQDENAKKDLGEDFWLALQGNVETGRLVLEDLEKRISGLKKNPAKFWIRTKYLWNGVIIGELQSQIQGLIAAMSILLQVIDIPMTGGKRSPSVAQKQRLNGLTVRNRNRAVEHHRQMQRAQEESLLDIDDTSPQQSTPNDLIKAHTVPPQTSRRGDPFSDDMRILDDGLGGQSFDSTSPPPYERYTSDNKTPPAMDLKNDAQIDRKDSQPEVGSKTSSFPVLEKAKSEESKESVDKKAKRPMWRTFMKRSSKQVPSQSFPNLADSTESHTSRSATPSASFDEVTSKSPETSAALKTSPDQENYLELQQAMSGMPMIGSTIESPQEHNRNDLGSNLGSSESTVAVEANVPAITTQSDERFASNNPYKQMRLESQSMLGSDVDSKSRPNYQDQRSGSTDNFSRIRPSQIVRVARERSRSQDPTARDNIESSPPPLEPLSRESTGGNRFGSISLSSLTDLQQTWQSTTLNNRTMKFKVQFEKESFTNRISASAARALGVDDTIEEVAGILLTQLTLLYTVSDGLSSEADTVLGDEAEFEVMNEHESRTPLLVLGAAFAHFARIMEEGQYVYWSPRSVPENLRNMERLRLYRRFELVRW